MSERTGEWAHDLLPLYHRVESAIQRWIQDRDLKPGGRLPSEEALAREYGVSRLTVREAMRRLAEAGYVTRVRGRGTFVTEKVKDKVTSSRFTGSLEDYYAEIQKVKVKSAQITEVAPPERIAESLQLVPGEPVVMVRRLRTVDDLPFAFTVNYIRPVHGRRLQEADLYRLPLVQIFEQVLGVVFGEAAQTIEARFATEEVATLLAVPFGAPVLHVERLMRDQAGAPVEVVQSSYRADRYRYTATLVRRRDDAFGWQYRTND
jgi:GntR family transcriptional regulator